MQVKYVYRKTHWIVVFIVFLSVENLVLLQKSYPHRWGGGMQNLGLRLAFTTFEKGGIFIVLHLLYVTQGRGLNISIRRTPFSWLLPHLGRGILTQIPMGPKKYWMYSVTLSTRGVTILQYMNLYWSRVFNWKSGINTGIKYVWIRVKSFMV